MKLIALVCFMILGPKHFIVESRRVKTENSLSTFAVEWAISGEILKEFIKPLFQKQADGRFWSPNNKLVFLGTIFGHSYLSRNMKFALDTALEIISNTLRP